MIAKVGMERIMNCGLTAKIIDIRSYKDIDIIFSNGIIRNNVRSDKFLNGSVLPSCRVLNPYSKYKSKYGHFDYFDFAISRFIGMHRRCGMFRYKKNYPTYADCYVCNEWYSFDSFINWVSKNYIKTTGINIVLDKDIKVRGNKVYSPDTCLLVPFVINTMFRDSKKSRGEFGLGVAKVFKRNSYRAQMSIGVGTISLGDFSNESDAVASYRNARESRVIDMANKYKTSMTQEAYDCIVSNPLNVD